MHHAELGPAVECPFSGSTRAISSAVSEILGTPDLAHALNLRRPEGLELLGLALNEVLHTITEFAGEQGEGDSSSVSLWLESRVMVICVKFRGRPLPDWILTNWDRAQEPAVLAPPCDAGWGWLLVREALDAVNHSWHGSQQVLFLERRVQV